MVKKILFVAAVFCLVSGPAMAQGTAKKAGSKKANATKAAEAPAKAMEAEEASAPAASDSGSMYSGHSNSMARPFHAGALLGWSFPSDGLDSRFTFGAEFGYRFIEHFRTSLVFLYGSKSYLRFASVNIWNLHLLPEYVCGGFHAGVKLGLSNVSVALFGAGAGGSTGFSFGPHVGYDFAVAENFSVGPAIEYIIVTGKADYQQFNFLVGGNVSF